MNQPPPPYDEPAYPPVQPNYPIPPLQPADAEQPGYPAAAPLPAELAPPQPQIPPQPHTPPQSQTQPRPLQATAEPVAPPPTVPAVPLAAQGRPATNPLQPDYADGYQHRPQPGPANAPEQVRTGGLAAPPPAPAPVMDPHPHNATDWTYTPRQTSITNRPTPAEWGWRARLRELSGGVLKLAPGPDELMHRAAVARIRSTLPGSRTVVVANEKGGAGKTPTALILSALLAEYRREAVVAWDVNELRGTLGLRAEITEPSLTVTDVLAASPELARPEAEVGVLSAYLRRQPQGNLVLASSEDGNAMRQIGHAECDIIRQLLLRRYGVVVCDTGNNAAAPNFLYTVDSADVLVLPTAPSDVHLEVARAMLRMLASRSTTSHLVSRAVLVVTSSTGARLEPEEERWFTDRIGRVVHVPADPIIAQGGKLTIGELSQTSIRAWTQVAGAVIEAALAPSPNDRPRGRRRAPDGVAASPLANTTQPAATTQSTSPAQPAVPAQPAAQPLSEIQPPSAPAVAPAPHQEQLNRQPPPLSAGWIPVTQPPGNPPR
ncbi:MAG: hypothetical protein M3Y89_09305 [Actinomycetota bacterium]|nr:hypothetical protein [Actinomycetota bacterium]